MTATMTLLQPTKEDLEPKYTLYQFYNTFGTWSKFIQSIGEPKPLTSRIPKEEIREYFDKIFPRNPPFPRLHHIHPPKYNYHAHMISKYWHRYVDFLIDIGRLDKDAVQGDHLRTSTVFWSHQDYVDQYNIVKTAIGQSPSQDDIDRLYHDGKIKMSGGSFQSRYTSLGRFKVLIGEQTEEDFRALPRREDWDLEDVAKFYNSVRRDDLNNIIRLSDMEQIFGALECRLRRRYKIGWIGFLKKYDKHPQIVWSCLVCGKKFKRYTWEWHSKRPENHAFRTKFCSYECQKKGHTTKVSKEELIANYYDLKKHLGRIPNRTDLNDRSVTPTKYSWHPYSAYWHSWYDFLLDMKEIKHDVNKRYLCSKQDVLDNFNLVAKRLGRCPTRSDLYDKALSKYPPHTINFFWGSWQDFLKDEYIEEKPVSTQESYNYTQLMRLMMDQRERIAVLERELAKK